MRDPYSVLGVAKDAKASEIKSAYRKLAKKYHPDQNASDPKAKDRFAEIGQAYEILKDEATRARYDRGEIDEAGKEKFHGFAGAGAGGDPFTGFARRGPGGFEFRSSSFGGPGMGGGNAEDLINELFGSAFAGASAGGRTRSRTGKGADLSAELRVTLREAAGAGKVQLRLPDGRTLAIKLPQGVQDGQVIRLAGQGEAGPGGMRGDALLTVRLTPEAPFRLEGDTVIADIDVPLADAVLGGKITVDTLDGRVALTVPAWSSSGKTLRLKGKGLPGKSGSRGDMLAVLRIALPETPDPALEALVRKQRG